MDDISTATFQLTSAKGPEPVVNVLQTIVKAFSINDARNVELGDIPLTTLQSLYEEMVIETEGPYQLKNFLSLLFDLVHKVLLSQTGTCDQVIVPEFHIMAAVYLNLHVNWPRTLLANIKKETKKVVCKFNDKGEVTELNVKNRLNFCTKIGRKRVNGLYQ